MDANSIPTMWADQNRPVQDRIFDLQESYNRGLITEREFAMISVAICEGGAGPIFEMVDRNLRREQDWKYQSDPYCDHPPYSDGHCATISCWNYYSRCRRHSPSGSSDAVCSIQLRKAEKEVN